MVKVEGSNSNILKNSDNEIDDINMKISSNVGN